MKEKIVSLIWCILDRLVKSVGHEKGKTSTSKVPKVFLFLPKEKKKYSSSSCRHTCWTSMKVCCPFLSLISDKLIMLSTCNNSQTFHVFLSPIFSSMMDCHFSLYNLFGFSICSGRIYIYIYIYGCFCTTKIWLPQKLAKGQRLCGLANSNNIASFSIIGAFMQPYSSIACLWAS